MSSEVAATFRNFFGCGKNRVIIRRKTNKLKLFMAYEPFDSVNLYPRTLINSIKGRRFLLVITGRFSKLTNSIIMRLIGMM